MESYYPFLALFFVNSLVDITLVIMKKGPSALDWQSQIYLNGFAGTRPSVNIDLTTLEESARKVISPEAFAYIAGGAGNESTVRANRDAFEKHKIVPICFSSNNLIDYGTLWFFQEISFSKTNPPSINGQSLQG